MNGVEAYNESLDSTGKVICDALRALFDHRLGPGAARLFHGSPVWFVEENPLVGYSLKKAGIAVLFWSGQSFLEPGLKPVGKFKAAEFVVPAGEEIPAGKLESWLAESKSIIWDYKNIAKRNGVLKLIEK